MANSIDLPLAEITSYMEGLLESLGVDCTIDGVSTKILISDIKDNLDAFSSNSKQIVISKTITVQKGSLVELHTGTNGIIYTAISDDMVSNSAKMLICNAVINVLSHETTYQTNGDISSDEETISCVLLGFIERVSAREKQMDIGLLYDTTLRLITFSDAEIVMDDIVDYKEKKYKVIDIDNITEGLLIIQLASIRT